MLRRLTRQLESLSRAEQQVGRWVLKHPRQAADASVAEVATAAATSQPTVVRFCRSIGLAGFRELKIRLAESLSRPASVLHRDVGRDDSIADVVSKVMDRSILTLTETRATALALPFSAAVEHLADARQIVFTGTGASGIVAADACHKFFRLGIPCIITTDPPTLLQLGAIADPRDVFVMVSLSGASPAQVTAAAALRERGIAVVAVTTSGSPLANCASLVFDIQSADDTSVYTPMSSRLALLALLDALQVSLALKLGDAAEARLRDTKRALQPVTGKLAGLAPCSRSARPR